MELAWGKNKHWLIPLVNGVPDKSKAIEIPTPADGTLQLNPTKGDKKEALIEGGEAEAVKYNKNKYEVVFEIRQGNEDGTPRKKPVEDEDGVVAGEYQYLCQPENADVEGIRIDRCVVSCADSLNMSDGGKWQYTIDCLKPKEGKIVKWEKIVAPSACLNNMQSAEYLNETLADAVMDRPREFFIGNKRYCLWSPTLGMSIMVSRHIKALCIDERMMSINPYMEAMRLAREKRNEICHILAILSFRTYLELTNTKTLERRAGIFSRSLDDEDLASLSLLALRDPKAETLISLSGIEKDQLEQKRISRHKNKDGHTLSFGGKTVFGSLIAVACSTFGWTKDYVVWGIDLVSLKLMLADTINTIYLSDDDIKALRINQTSRQVYGMTPEDIAKLKAMNWD